MGVLSCVDDDKHMGVEGATEIAGRAISAFSDTTWYLSNSHVSYELTSSQLESGFNVKRRIWQQVHIK